MPSFLKLGWSNPRPNDFEGPDLRPLKDLFGNLQQFLTFPHVGVSISGAFNTLYTDKTLTAISGAPFNANFDPYSLVRNNTIQAPRDFDSYLFVGAAGVLLSNAGNGRYIMGWRYNGATLNEWIGEVHSASGLSVRVVCPLIRPVKKGDTLAIAVAAPGNGTVDEGEAWGVFLPLT